MNIKDLHVLTFCETYQGEPHTLPPSRTKPRELTIHLASKTVQTLGRAKALTFHRKETDSLQFVYVPQALPFLET